MNPKSKRPWVSVFSKFHPSLMMAKGMKGVHQFRCQNVWRYCHIRLAHHGQKPTKCWELCGFPPLQFRLTYDCSLTISSPRCSVENNSIQQVEDFLKVSIILALLMLSSSTLSFFRDCSLHLNSTTLLTLKYKSHISRSR